MSHIKKVALAVLVASLLGLLASGILIVDKLALVSGNELPVPCNLNPLFSCVEVMKTSYAETAGIPNPLFGVMGYSFMATVGLVFLLYKEISANLLRVALIGSSLAFAFSYYLLGVSMFVIGAICPFCLLSCLAATLIFWQLVHLSLLTPGVFPDKLLGLKPLMFLATGKGLITVIVIWLVLAVLSIWSKFPALFSF